MNYEEYKAKLKLKTFDSFILDRSNEEAYAGIYALCHGDAYIGKRVILKGPLRSGRGHLIAALIERLMCEKPYLKIQKLYATDFAARITADALNGHYDLSSGVDDRLVNELLDKDVLVIENLNEIAWQLSGDYHSKKTLCYLLDRWDHSHKMMIVTVCDSWEQPIEDNDILFRLSDFDVLRVMPQSRECLRNWLDYAIFLSGMKVEGSVREQMIKESDNIAHCRYLLWQHSLQSSADGVPVEKNPLKDAGSSLMGQFSKPVRMLFCSYGFDSPVMTGKFEAVLPRKEELKQKKVAIIPFAGIYPLEMGRHEKQHLIDYGFADENVYVVNDRGFSECVSPDYIYVPGGDTFRLLREIRKRHLEEEIVKRVLLDKAVYIGVSAGAYIAATDIWYVTELEDNNHIESDFGALGLVDRSILCHYDCYATLKACEKKSKKAFMTIRNDELLFCKNGEFFYIE